ncbi:MAG: metal-dependent hydrolase, partial [Alphaproteobacteria bacterium]|nr:metal-dependent hydrolase [Alphaproteobacteria bacterium]
LGIALGAGFFIAIAALLQGFQHDFVAKLIDVAPHVLVKDEYRTPAAQPLEREGAEGLAVVAGVRPRPPARGIKNFAETLAALADEPGAYAAPVMRAPVILRYGTTSEPVTLLGIEPDLHRRVSNLDRDLAFGSLADLAATADGLILGEGVARRLAAGPRDAVMVRGTAGNEIALKVVGIFHTGVPQLDESQGYVLLKRAQTLEGRPNVVNQIHVRLDDNARAIALAERLERDHGFRAEPWQETHSSVLGLFGILNAVTFTALGGLFMMSGTAVYNMVSTVTMEKVRDIAILRSLGFPARFVIAIFLVEGLILGMLGAELGCLLGHGAVSLLAEVPVEIHGPIIQSNRFLLYDWIGHYGIAATAAVGTACLGALLPARRAARADPLVVLRGAVGSAVDLATHALAGILIARTRRSWLDRPAVGVVLVAASLLPDIDVLAAVVDPTNAALDRHTLTHSLLVLPVLAAGFAGAVRLATRRVGPGEAFGLAVLGIAVHLLLDLINAYGVALLYPLSDTRFELPLLFVVDPILTGTLLAMLAASLWAAADPRWKAALARSALVLGVTYLGATAHVYGQARTTLAALDADGPADGVRALVPEPLSLWRWRGILGRPGGYGQVLIDPLSGTVSALPWVPSADDDPRVAAVRRSGRLRDAEAFLRAPVWTVEGGRVTVHDLRYRFAALGNRWDPFLFDFETAGDEVHVMRAGLGERIGRIWATIGEMTGGAPERRTSVEE